VRSKQRIADIFRVRMQRALAAERVGFGIAPR
jgi:hypothetical protein